MIVTLKYHRAGEWRTATIPRPTILTDSEDLRFLLFKRNVPTELPT